MRYEEHARTSKLRRLMRTFNLKRDERSAFALEMELMSGGHEVLYPALSLSFGEQVFPMALAVPGQGICTLEVFTTKRLVPVAYKPLTMVSATIPDLIKQVRGQLINAFIMDSYTKHCTGLYMAEDKVKLLPLCNMPRPAQHAL